MNHNKIFAPTNPFENGSQISVSSHFSVDYKSLIRSRNFNSSPRNKQKKINLSLSNPPNDSFLENKMKSIPKIAKCAYHHFFNHAGQRRYLVENPNDPSLEKSIANEKSFKKAYIRTKTEKMERVKTMRNEQEEYFCDLKDRIKQKLIPKKAKVELNSPQKIDEKTWFNNWKKCVSISKEIKREKVLRKLKTSSSRKKDFQVFGSPSLLS